MDTEAGDFVWAVWIENFFEEAEAIVVWINDVADGVFESFADGEAGFVGLEMHTAVETVRAGATIGIVKHFAEFVGKLGVGIIGELVVIENVFELPFAIAFHEFVIICFFAECAGRFGTKITLDKRFELSFACHK